MSEFICPGCGAPLQVSGDPDFITCSFCSRVIDTGLNPEMRLRKKGKETAQKVRQYGKNLNTLSCMEKDIVEKTEQVKTAEEKKKSYKSTVIVAALFIWIFCTAAIYFWLEEALWSYDGFRVFCDIFLPAAAAAGIIYLVRKLLLRKLPVIQAEAEKQRSILNEAENSLEKFRDSFDMSFMPEKYRTEKDIGYIANALETEKAYTLSQAMALCDDRKDRDAFEERQQKALSEMEKLANSKKPEKNDGSELIGVAAAAVGTAVAGKVVKEIFRHL